MVKLLIAFIFGWCACVLVAGLRNRVNAPPVEVYTESGGRVR